MADPKSDIQELNRLKGERQALQSKKEAARRKPDTATASPPEAPHEQPAGDDSTVRNLSKNLEGVFEDVKRVASEHPTVALLAAFGIGFVVGRYTSRR